LQTCRRQYLLRYFDEDATDNCGSCDVCLSEYEKIDGTIIAQKAFSAISRLGESFGMGYLIDFLRGSKNDKIRDAHKQLKTYGIGADISKADWQQYIRELMARGYIRSEGDPYPILKLNATAADVLKGLQKVELTQSQTIHEEQAAEVIPYEAGLLMELKEIRLKIATRENVPAYVILSDATLLEIATYLPADLSELRQISGFGDVKLQRYGDEFSQAVTQYCGKHGLQSRIDKKAPKRERKVKTSVGAGKASSTQVETLRLYKSGSSVAEIAHERQLSPTTIEGHLSQFVTSGEIDVLELVSAEKIDPIKNAVESYGADRLSPLKEILGDNYSYGEIKAVIALMQRETA